MSVDKIKGEDSNEYKYEEEQPKPHNYKKVSKDAPIIINVDTIKDEDYKFLD